MDWNSVFATRASRMNASEIRELLKLLDQPDIISFAGGIPDPKLFPHVDFGDAMAEIFASEEHNTALQYSVSEGYSPLRNWIAGEMAKIGIPCDRNNILITSGSQQALDYLGKLFLSPKDTALVGWPTYLGALGAFNAYEPNYDQLSPNGNRSATEISALAGQNGGAVKFAYTSVDFANPTGETLDFRGRTSLLNLAEELDIPVIEDAAYQALRYKGEPVPPILALDIERTGDIENTRTLYCGSFSKTLSPGLRVGWVCAAKDVISKLVLIKQASDLHSPTLNQMAIAKVAERHFDEHVAMVRASYTKRCTDMLSALNDHMPDGVEWTNPDGGMFIWLTLPKSLNAADLLAESLKTERIAFVPGTAFFADGSGQNTLRLSFSCAEKSQIEEGMKRLGRLLKKALI
ncbi:MAG: PLP-dependent aminotransferase family protein [Pseudoruegeria sp.]